MALYPTSFFVWRPAAAAYLFYTVIYDTSGAAVRIINEEPPKGLGSVHNYEHSFTHSLGIRRSPNRIRFYDFVERSCIRLIHSEPTDPENGYWIHREREIPILEPEIAAVLPREMSCSTAAIIA
jgi:hypothetical protein